jgi:hypothetical protein
MMPAASHTDDRWVDELPEPLRTAALANARERIAQGLPAHLEDPVVFARLACILDTPTSDALTEVAS